MRNVLPRLALCFIASAALSASAAHDSENPVSLPQRLLVQVSNSQASNPTLSGFGVSLPIFTSNRIVAEQVISWTPQRPDLVRELGLDRYYALTPAPGWGWMDVLNEIPADATILGLEPVGELHFDGTASGAKGSEYPNDPSFADQYALQDSPAGIGTLGAWRETYGNPQIVIAVVDSGVSSTHPDLVNQLVTGYNAIDGSSNTDDGFASHGTHIAGILAASTDNKMGIAGVSRGSMIMPIKSFYSSGFGLEGNVAQGIIWATDHGADVISMSFGFRTVLGPLQSAIQYAYDNGVVLVASTGNVPTQAIGFPAQYAQVIGVGATGKDGLLWPSSSTGSAVFVVAPGEEILSTWDTPFEPHTYTLLSGTSMATPHVSGLVGLILSIAPNLLVDEVFWVLRESSTDLGSPGIDTQYGAGLINARAAVHSAFILATVGCRADLSGDGLRDSADIAIFVELFLSGDPAADVAIPFGVLDNLDIVRYIEIFNLGCL